MRIVSAYCPHCEANVTVSCVPDGETSVDALPSAWWPAVVLRCQAGHVIARLGAMAVPDPVTDLLLSARGAHESTEHHPA